MSKRGDSICGIQWKNDTTIFVNITLKTLNKRTLDNSTENGKWKIQWDTWHCYSNTSIKMYFKSIVDYY